MQKESLMTVKKAAQKLGLDERAVVDRLASGELKGEKKSNWLRDEWFVYNGAVQTELTKKKQTKEPSTSASKADSPKPETKIAERPPTVEAEAMPDEASEAGEWLRAERSRLEQIVEHMMRPLVEKVAAQAEALAEKDLIIQEQDIKLRLLPDLEKKAREQDELTAKSRVEVRELREQLNELLIIKTQLDQAEFAKQEMETFMNQELERLKREKELNEQAAENQLLLLQSQIEDLRKPWWKKMFAP